MLNKVILDSHIQQADSLIHDAETCNELTFSLKLNELHDLLKRMENDRKMTSTLYQILQNRFKLFEFLGNSKSISTKVKYNFEEMRDNIELSITKLESTKEILNQAHSNCLKRTMKEIMRAESQSDSYLNAFILIFIFTIPFQMISSLFGMNVRVPFQDENNLAAFFIIVTIAGIIAFGLLFICGLYLWIINMKKNQQERSEER